MANNKLGKALLSVLMVSMAICITACTPRGTGNSEEQKYSSHTIINSSEQTNIKNSDQANWKKVAVQMQVQTDQTGIIDGEYINISILVPKDWEFITDEKIFTENDETRSSDYFATRAENKSPSLSSIVPENKMGYISHQTIQLSDKTEVLLTILEVFMGKDRVLDASEREYSYSYNFIHGDSIISISFQAIGADNAEAIEIHKEVLESIQYNE